MGQSMDTPITPPTGTAPDDHEVVAALLGRRPKGRFEVVVRDDAGVPVVIRNHPLLEDGRPMPTRFWLVGDDLRSRIGTLESTGGVRAAEVAVTRHRVTPWRSIAARYPRSTSSTRSMACWESRPVASTPSPIRVMCMSRSTVR